MKYVAFLDILGFKEKLKTMEQDKAKEYIVKFADTIAKVWKQKAKGKLIHGYLVSDSLVVYSDNDSVEALQTIVDIIKTICIKEFEENELFIRGAISKGNFDYFDYSDNKDIAGLSCEILVGQAYADAYCLEDTYKYIGIILDQQVHSDLIKNDSIQSDCFEITKEGEEIKFLLRYISLEYLSNDDKLKLFIKLANEAKWLPHYYNTMAMALRNIKDEAKVEKLMINIFTYLLEEKNRGYHHMINRFIENCFHKDVEHSIKERLLKYLRKKIYENTEVLLK